jgi:glucose/mannose transport system permease protein
MIPLVQLITNFHLIGGIPGLMLAHIVYGIPICTLIFRNYYASIPEELTDAAKVDGAGMLRTYRSVVLPDSAPAFAVTLIWQFTSLWNDFLFAVFLTGPAS